jgi:VWFA-related protein
MAHPQRLSVFSIFATLLALLCAPLASPGAQAQEGQLVVGVVSVDDQAYPQVQLTLSVTTPQGLPLKELGPANFTLSQQGAPVEPISVSSFRDLAIPLSFVLAIDTSGSMAGAPLQKAIQAGEHFIASLAPADSVAILAFSDSPSLIQAPTTDKQVASGALQNLKAGGGTALYDALIAGVDLLSQAGSRRALVLLTDGEDTSKGATTLQTALLAAAQASVPIYPIGFGQVRVSELQAMADSSGSTLQIEPDANSLDLAFQNVLELLHEQVLVSFTAAWPVDDAPHDLLVKVQAQGASGERIAQFVARRRPVTIALPQLSEGQVLRSRVVLKPEVQSPALLSRLTLALDGQTVAVLDSPPWEFRWDPTAYLAGSHALTLEAEDAIGNSGSLDLDLVSEQPLGLRVLLPSTNLEISGTGRVLFTLEDEDDLGRAEIYCDDQSLGTLTQSPFDLTWDASSLQPGEHQLRIVLVDRQGNSYERSLPVLVAAQQAQAQQEPAQKAALALPISWPAAGGAAGALAIVAGAILLTRRRRQRPARTGGHSNPQALSPTTPLARLSELKGIHAGTTWQLGTAEVRLGRAAKWNEIPVLGRSALEQQAIIRYVEGRHYVYSIDVEHPAYVNDIPVQPQSLLNTGDSLRVGESVFWYEALPAESQ